MDDILNSLLSLGCLGSTIAVTSFLTIALRWSYRRHDVLRTVILGLTLLHETALVTFPVWYAVLSNFKLEREMITGPGPAELLIVMFGETFFVGLFTLALNINSGPVQTHSENTLIGIKTTRPVLILLTVLGIFLALREITAPVASVEEAVRYADVKAYPGTGEMLAAWLFYVFQIPTLLAAAILFSRRGESTITRMLTVANMALNLTPAFAVGHRARFTWIGVAVLAFSWVYKEKIKQLASVMLVTILLPLFAFFGGQYRFDVVNHFAGISQFRVLGYFRDSLQQGISNLDGSPPLEAFALRAEGPRNSTVLYSLYDQGHGAGIKPLIASVYFIVPRVLWPNKRPAGGTDESPYSGAMYVVKTYGHGAPTYVMGPLLASAHAYWEGGWFAVALAGLATGVIWRLILKFVGRLCLEMALLIGMVFATAFMIDGLYTALSPLYAIMRVFWQSIVPIVFLAWAARALYGKRRTLPRGTRRAFYASRFAPNWRLVLSRADWQSRSGSAG